MVWPLRVDVGFTRPEERKEFCVVVIIPVHRSRPLTASEYIPQTIKMITITITGMYMLDPPSRYRVSAGTYSS